MEFLVRREQCRVRNLKGVDVQGIHQVASSAELHSPSGKKSSLFPRPYGTHVGAHRGENPEGLWRMYLNHNESPESEYTCTSLSFFVEKVYLQLHDLFYGLPAVPRYSIIIEWNS